MNKNFCVLPWIHMHSYPHGAAAPCCSYDQSLPIGDIKTQTISEIQKSKTINIVRKKMLNDETVEGCRTCNVLETVTKESARFQMNSWFANQIDEAIQNTNADGSLKSDFKQKYMNVRYSNLCNFACRTCGPTHSSLWAQENKDPNPVKHILDSVPHYKQEVTDHLKWVERINFAGGESLLIPEHWEILDRLIDLGRTHVTITYFTNLSKLTYQQKNIIDYMNKFPNMKLYASIDASHERAEIYRHGTIWSTVEQNLKKLFESNVTYMVWTTVGAMNVWHVPDLQKYLLTNNLALPTQLKVSNLVDSPWLSTKILPLSLKEEITNKIKDHQQWLIKEGYNFPEWDSIINFMNSEDHSFMLDRFREYNLNLDSVRNQSSTKVFHELSKIWYPYSDSNGENCSF